MKRMSLCWLALCLALGTWTAAAMAQDGPSTAAQAALANRLEAEALAEQARQERLLAAVPIEIVSPFYSVRGGDDSRLIVLNTVSYPVEFDLTAVNPKGEVLPLGRYQVEPQSHFSMLLGESVRAAGGDFGEGSLRLSLLGDDETLQSWLVLERGGQEAEITLNSQGEVFGKQLTTFWDASRLDGARPDLYLVNVGAAPLTYSVQGSVDAEAQRTLAPGERHHLTSAAASGWLTFSHDGADGALMVAGYLAGQGYLSRLPVFTADVIERTVAFDAVRVPMTDTETGGTVRSQVELLNTATEPRETYLEVVNPATGTTLMRTRRVLQPGQVTSVDFGRVVREVMGEDPHADLRLSVASDGAGVLASGFSQLPSGEVIDLAFFPRQAAHANGSYPLPALEQNDVFTTVVNLGDEDAVIVAHFAWEDGGAYAWGPVVVPAGASYRIDAADVAAHGEPDVLGRRLSADFHRGFVRWRVQSGSRELIGRTEVRPKGGQDTYGFNCFGCCSEFPHGSVEPDYVEFFPGQSPVFEACVTIETCTGTEGPWPAYVTSLTVPSPFSWNGSNIGASSEAQDVLSFEGLETRITPTCSSVQRPIFGAGTGNACKNLLRKAHKPTQFWSVYTTCVSQVGSETSGKCSKCQACCNQILAWKQCTKTGLLTANSEHQACLANCATDVC